MSSRYVIRGYHWGYNDETFYPCGSYIRTIFENEAEAKAALIELERHHWENCDLGETNAFFDPNPELVDRANSFIKERLGKPLFVDDDPRGTYVPQELSDEDFLEFLRLAELNAYKLTKFDDSARAYAIWFQSEGDYLKVFEEYFTALIWGASIEELKKAAMDELYYKADELVAKGSLEELTDNPELLKRLIETSEGLSYDEDAQELATDAYDPDSLFAVNELLKKPFFEIRSLTLDEVLELEAELEEEEEAW